MTTGKRTDPYLGFRFRVELDSLDVAGFSEVEGLEIELETETYEEGGVNRYTHTLPKRFSYPNLTLRHGLSDSEELWKWMTDAVHGSIERKSGRIILLDRTGQEVRGWEFREGYPVRWDGPELAADQGAVAIEALEIAHNGLGKHEI